MDYPVVAERAGDAEGFVPAGWRLEQRHAGDLDGDGRDDLVLLLKMDDPGNRIPNEALGPPVFDTNPRMLVAAFAERPGGYRRVLADHALIPRPYSPTLDDFLSENGGVGIVDGALRIGLHLWASAGTWSTSRSGFTFRWREGCFRLVGHDHRHLHRGSGAVQETSANYLTRRAWRAEGSIEDDAMEKTWLRLPAQPLRCLEDIGDGFAFDPGVPPTDP
ncbi:hypothetical protein H0E84_08485 [Luteimonas sp. SJ-92]|uniref:VCBS repeat-containing protein n=1 Tax=Luteimonas salinisoli TaxID=2752307 RepID=A0A853JCC9_9GAMM|nr:hypothetical protein [Luteimonas salinisoli]